MISFQWFPIVRKYLGTTSILSYSAISNMPNQKWFCLRTFGGHLLQGTERTYDLRSRMGQDHIMEKLLQACGLEVLTGQLITGLVSHCPASQFKCCLHIFFSLSPLCSQRSSVSSLWWCCTGHMPWWDNCSPSTGGQRQDSGEQNERYPVQRTCKKVWEIHYFKWKLFSNRSV